MKTHVKCKSTLVSGHPQEPRGRPPPLHDPERHRGNHPTGQCSSSHPLLSTAGLLVFVGLLFAPTGQRSSPHLLLSTAGLLVFVGLLFAPTGQRSSPHLLLSTAGLFVFVGPLFEARVWF